MELYNRILNNEKYRDLVKTLEAEEKDREFCRHGFVHFLDVARIAYIENLEKGLNISKENIYAAALLHDLGRCSQFEKHDNHNSAGAQIAAEILEECGCEAWALDEIVAAIFNHGNIYISSQNNLCGLIYRADKKSRNCYMCEACESCNWSEDKKNKALVC